MFTALYIDVLLPLALRATYTYRVPIELNEEVAIGKRVVVQFGKKRIYSGLIIGISEDPPTDHQAKYILSVLDALPIIDQVHLKFWKWIAAYYMCTLGEVMNAALPKGLKLQSESKISLIKDIEELPELDQREQIIIDHLRSLKSMTLDQIEALLKQKSSYKIVKSLYEKGLISLDEEIKGGYKARIRSYIRLSSEIDVEQLHEIFSKLERRAPLQLKVLMQLIHDDRERQGLDKNKWIKENDLSASAVKSLIGKEIIELFEVEVDRIQFEELEEYKINKLTSEQEEVYTIARNAFQEHQPLLLEGVTSSGKTHVYIQLIEDCLEKGEQVLYLLPEISLTTQLIKRIQSYFGEIVMVTHSRFGNHERVEVWEKIRSKEAMILIAPRSGLFAPFENLGLILVDEEHENSYKQHEPAPRYHARDAALVLAQINEAQIVLGSATPSIESSFNAKNGKYAYAKLESRFAGSSIPDFSVVNMREERRLGRAKGIFSGALLKEIENCLDQDEQFLLFLNRKGFVPITECTECSWTPQCIRCDISLTYYKRDNCLRCHFCGYQIAPIHKCPRCGNHDLKMAGYGTERVETELQILYPEMRIQRFDQLTTRTKNAYQRIISDFEEHKTDVLIGTQMITKGLDFNKVNLVGILDADHALNFPDFRAYERSFQLMVQVGGRAGRRDKKGLVLIQTNQAEHPVIQQIVDHDYDGLYSNEIEERKQYSYPPFNRIIKIIVKHKDYLHTEKAGEYLNWLLKPELGESILGPEEPFISRIRGLYIRQFLIKLDPNKSRKEIKAFIAQKVSIFKSNKDYRNVRLILDVDPA